MVLSPIPPPTLFFIAIDHHNMKLPLTQTDLTACRHAIGDAECSARHRRRIPRHRSAVSFNFAYRSQLAKIASGQVTNLLHSAEAAATLCELDILHGNFDGFFALSQVPHLRFRPYGVSSPTRPTTPCDCLSYTHMRTHPSPLPHTRSVAILCTRAAGRHERRNRRTGRASTTQSSLNALDTVRQTQARQVSAHEPSHH